jgi:hypothetical protein
VDIFRSQVLGPVFEEQSRTWVRRFVSNATLSARDHIGPPYATVDEIDRQLDVLVAGPGEVPGEWTIVAIGEAKSGVKLTSGHLQHLERVRRTFGEAVIDAKLLLFGPLADATLLKSAAKRNDVEVARL